MSNAFISFAEEDHYFVDLLVAIFEFHRISTWCSTKDIPLGINFKKYLEEGIRTAEFMLVKE